MKAWETQWKAWERGYFTPRLTVCKLKPAIAWKWAGNETTNMYAIALNYFASHNGTRLYKCREKHYHIEVGFGGNGVVVRELLAFCFTTEVA